MLPNIHRYIQNPLNLVNSISFNELLFILLLVVSIVIVFSGFIRLFIYTRKITEKTDKILEVVYSRKQSDALLFVVFGMILLVSCILHLFTT